jgi:hypothetical protein
MENSIADGKFDRDKAQYCVKIDETGVSNTQSQKGNFLSIPTKLLKCYLTLFVLFLIYLILLLTRSKDEVYVVVGGFLGVLSSVNNISNQKLFDLSINFFLRFSGLCYVRYCKYFEI